MAHRLTLAVAAQAACCILIASLAHAEYDPLALFLTWRQDPASTITIDWHSLPAESRTSQVAYRPMGFENWRFRTGHVQTLPGAKRIIHRVELTGLQPATMYEFRLGPDSRIFSFRTMPATADEPVVFAIGGDTRHRREWMEQTNREAMKFDPDFIAWGGDLAYDDALIERADKIVDWFDACKATLITPEGRVVPVVVGIGNHEVVGGYWRNTEGYKPTDAWRLAIAPFFFRVFAFPGQPGYGVLDFGDYMSLIVADTDHANPMDGAQLAWLEKTLAERSRVPHVFPMYHAPAYPSHRDYGNSLSRKVRELWVPLFEAYGVEVAFENHDHTYKRTVPILGGEPHPNGVVYMGDGAWGVSTRDVHPPEDAWYLAEALPKRHFILVTLQGEERRIDVYDENGAQIDLWAPPPAPPAPECRARHKVPGAHPADVNGDGRVNAIDIQLVTNHLLGRPVHENLQPDVNKDGLVNALDVQAVINAVLGLPLRW